MTLPYDLLFAGRIECCDLAGLLEIGTLPEYLCDGVRMCGTSEINRCTCGLRLVVAIPRPSPPVGGAGAPLPDGSRRRRRLQPLPPQR